MTTIVKLATLPLYPAEYVSRGVIASIQKQGLIEPILIMPNGEVHKHDREHYMAFRHCVEQLGDAGVDDIIVTYYDDMDEDEKLEYT